MQKSRLNRHQIIWAIDVWATCRLGDGFQHAKTVRVSNDQKQGHLGTNISVAAKTRNVCCRPT